MECSGVVAGRIDLHWRDYKNVRKMTLRQAVALEDSSGLFNSGLEGHIRRSIDFHEGEKIDEKALKGLIRAAVTLNTSRADG